MTIHQQFPLPQYGTASGNHEEDDEDSMSPSDGYFGQRGAVPDTVYIPTPTSSTMDKAREAAAESGQSSPVTARQSIYTPATTATPASPSRRDSGSAYNGSAGRYRDIVAPRDLLADDPPPEYSPSQADWSQSQRSPTIAELPANQYRDAVPNRVRQTIPPSSHAALPRCQTAFSPRSQCMADLSQDVDHMAEDESPLLPVTRAGKPKRHTCYAKQRHRHFRGDRRDRYRNRKRGIGFAIGVFGFIWLMVHLAIKIHTSHVRVTSPILLSHMVMPTNNFTRPTSPPHSTGRVKLEPTHSSPSRSIRQHETSTSISGTYDLYDLLDLSTTSGSITITIIPHPGSVPAVLKLSTASGSINIRLPPNSASIPDRLYQSTISTKSGSVNGDLLISGAGLGATAAVSAVSGSINLSLHPFVSPSFPGAAYLSTSSNSGSQSLGIKSPTSFSLLRNLTATHTANGSGSLNIKYPGEWRGIVHAKSLGSGSVRAMGDGLQYSQRGSREVLAWRGGDQGETELEQLELLGKGSGSITFGC